MTKDRPMIFFISSEDVSIGGELGRTSKKSLAEHSKGNCLVVRPTSFAIAEMLQYIDKSAESISLAKF